MHDADHLDDCRVHRLGDQDHRARLGHHLGRRGDLGRHRDADRHPYLGDHRDRRDVHRDHLLGAFLDHAHQADRDVIPEGQGGYPSADADLDVNRQADADHLAAAESDDLCPTSAAVAAVAELGGRLVKLGVPLPEVRVGDPRARAAVLDDLVVQLVA